MTGARAEQDRAIDAFWAFWATAGHEVARSFAARKPMSKELIAGFSEHVHAIDPSLDWEFGPGVISDHHFCISGKGDPVLRAICERWLAKAPERTTTWEFHAARQPHRGPGLKLSIDGHDVALDELAAGATVDESREVIDLELHHPVFADIEDEELRARIAFIGLDTLLGEDRVERWLGAIELARERPDDAVTLAELRGQVDALARRATGDRWSLLRGERDGLSLHAAVSTAIKRVDHLELDTHVELAIPIVEPHEETGLPDAEENSLLGDMELDLVERLGKRAVLIAHETWNGTRTIHLHMDPSREVIAAIDAWRADHPDRAIEVTRKHDPRWEILSRWR